MIQRLMRSSLVHMAFGFLAMGGWALFANRAHGWEQAWAPALAQGTVSALLTGVIKRALEAMDGRVPGLGAFVVPPLVTASGVLATLFTVHSLIGTPELAATIAFPWSLSTLYAFIYNAALVRARRNAP
ncbi:hypothetical protein GVN21_02615 [Caulobacter sp. SLTY]|uniref:hypothetical protein n=1 Tax=Caulobacter sp. SLTY TaxID=2683262 RepID=UPI0014128C65|nr:hypothetical protein [Caulobacter sp. SLTY]NBB14245.1 hypothetical protein [Caulobacter sp. SLTY]